MILEERPEESEAGRRPGGGVWEFQEKAVMLVLFPVVHISSQLCVHGSQIDRLKSALRRTFIH